MGAFIRDYISKMIVEFSEVAESVDFSTGGQKAEENMPVGGVQPIQYIVIEMTPVMSVDSTALHMLEDMCRDLRERGIRVAFSTIGNRVEDSLKRAGLIDKLGAQWIHPSVHSAVEHCVRHRQLVRDEIGAAAENNVCKMKPQNAMLEAKSPADLAADLAADVQGISVDIDPDAQDDNLNALTGEVHV